MGNYNIRFVATNINRVNYCFVMWRFIKTLLSNRNYKLKFVCALCCARDYKCQQKFP